MLVVLAAWVACVVLHNVIYALFHDSFGPGGDEPFFMFLAVVVIPAYVLIAVIYTVVQRFKSRH